jgi:hypothetical protein
MRSRGTPNAATASARGRETATTRRARGSAQRRLSAMAGCLASTFMSEPWTLTTAGTPSSRASSTPPTPSGNAQEASSTSYRPRRRHTSPASEAA